MVVHHRVVSGRLTREYFRRWHYWHGISRAVLYWRFGFDPEEPETIRHDTPPPSLLDVPYKLIKKSFFVVRSYLWRTLRREPARSFDYEIWLAYFAGFVLEIRRQRHLPFASVRPREAAAGGQMPRVNLDATATEPARSRARPS